MQFAKDSFYMALRERLASLNPLRTVTLNGATRPAVIVAENELVIPVEPLPDAFYIEWAAAQAVENQMGSRALMTMDCVISHLTFGTAESGVDRGRTLAALDMELTSICQPGHTAKRDFTQAPSTDLGTNIFWTVPRLGAVTGSDGPRNETIPGKGQSARLERKALLQVFFFTEVNTI
jgi:hypothetical protein